MAMVSHATMICYSNDDLVTGHFLQEQIWMIKYKGWCVLEWMCLWPWGKILVLVRQSPLCKFHWTRFGQWFIYICILSTSYVVLAEESEGNRPEWMVLMNDTIRINKTWRCMLSCYYLLPARKSLYIDCVIFSHLRISEYVNPISPKLSLPSYFKCNLLNMAVTASPVLHLLQVTLKELGSKNKVICDNCQWLDYWYYIGMYLSWAQISL